MQRATMTLQECAAAMRQNGIRCSPMRIGEAIESGNYPFGRLVYIGGSGRRTFEIFRVDFYKWLNEKVGKTGENI